jgi:hypothetical protein
VAQDKERLSAAQAQGIVDELIEAFGLGAYPKVTVSEVAPGRWRISWREMEDEAPAMTKTQWEQWLRRRVGSITPERLETSEG